MAINTNNLGSIQAYQKLAALPNADIASTKANQHSRVAQSAEQTTTLDATKMTIRNERQASLVAHLFGNGQSAESSSLQLTFQAAIEKLNELLTAKTQPQDVAQDNSQVNPQDTPADPQNGKSPKPISEQALKQQGGMDYWTPENTAKRIVGGAVAFLGGFQKAHPDLQGEELMNKFMDVVGGGLTQGFDEAKGILGDLNVLQGDIATNIESTYKLVQDGMVNFKNQFLGIKPTDDGDATNVPAATAETATSESTNETQETTTN